MSAGDPGWPKWQEPTAKQIIDMYLRGPRRWVEPGVERITKTQEPDPMATTPTDPNAMFTRRSRTASIPVRRATEPLSDPVAAIEELRIAADRAHKSVQMLSGAVADGDSYRWVSIARTHLQQGLMALERAVDRPEGF